MESLHGCQKIVKAATVMFSFNGQDDRNIRRSAAVVDAFNFHRQDPHTAILTFSKSPRERQYTVLRCRILEG